ncbi:hypothetical protein D9M68_673730 [compost metagenome]
MVPGCQTTVEDGFPFRESAPVRLSVPEFIQHAFNGRFWFGLFRAGSTITVTLVGAFTKCWKCGGWTNVVAEVQVSSADTHHELDIQLEELPAIPFLMDQLPLEKGLRDRKIGRITMRYSKTEGGEYLANGCVNCNALQGKFFLHELYHRLKPVYSQTLVVTREFEQFLREFAREQACWRLDMP